MSTGHRNDQRRPAKPGEPEAVYGLDLNRMLEERRKQHGSFLDHATITQSFKQTAHDSPGWDRLSDTQREGVEMILHKLGRILAGDPNHHDHWDDIGGYARITRECIPRSSETTKPDPL